MRKNGWCSHSLAWKITGITLLLSAPTAVWAEPLSTGSESSARLVSCKTRGENTPIFIDAHCVDSDFSNPVIDRISEIYQPVRLHKVTGHFEGTDATFSFYYPPKSQWDGRFFHKVYPYTDGKANTGALAFGYDSGAYVIQTGKTSGYRADAAAAKFSRLVARQYYKEPDRKIYGYIYGGSGGSYQAIAAMENTVGIWDGAVPYVMGVPTSIPNNFFVRVLARVVLKDKANQISETVLPGGSGNPFASLNRTERSILEEVTSMGLPLESWAQPGYVLGLEDTQGLMGFRSTIQQIDPTYVNDFWTDPGYLGTEQSELGELFRRARIDYTTTFRRSEDSKSLELAEVPTDGFTPEFEYTLLDLDGVKVGEVLGTLDSASRRLSITKFTPSNNRHLEEATSIRVSNDWALALAVYHRHQVPGDKSFHAWDQFRNDDGSSRQPQRSIDVGPIITGGASGGGQFTGRYNGKMIVVGNLLDADAFPWDGDWYSQRVWAADAENFDKRFRLWLNENADHYDGSVIISGRSDQKSVRLVNYVGILERALLDVSAWVEQDTPAPLSTKYRLANQQVSVEKSARERDGVQPGVDLRVGSKPATELDVGDTAYFSAHVSVPAGQSTISSIEWSPLGNSDFVPLSFEQDAQGTIEIRTAYVFNQPGTYYPVIRVAAQRGGDDDSPFARAQNLARVKVVVN